jgi:hypothetical protein
MPATSRDRQIRIRISKDTDKHERQRDRDLELLKMFNEAAADVTAEDREERESLLGGFADGRTS